MLWVLISTVPKLMDSRRIQRKFKLYKTMTPKFTPLKDHDTPIKVLFTGYLCTVGIGYLFALIQILFTHGMADGKFGLSVDDIVYSYYGNRSGTVLEQKLNGSMKENAPEQERFKIMEWVRAGADVDDYKDDGIDKIIETRCVICHNKEASGIPSFTEFEGLKALYDSGYRRYFRVINADFSYPFVRHQFYFYVCRADFQFCGNDHNAIQMYRHRYALCVFDCRYNVLVVD